MGQPLRGLLGELKSPKYHCATCNGLPWACTCNRKPADLAQWIRWTGEDLEKSLGNEPEDASLSSLRKVLAGVGTNAPDWFFYEYLDKIGKPTLMQCTPEERMAMEIAWRRQLLEAIVLDELGS